MYAKVRNALGHATVKDLLKEKTARIQAANVSPSVAIFSYGEGIDNLIPSDWTRHVVHERKVARIRAGVGADTATRKEYCVIVPWAAWRAHFS